LVLGDVKQIYPKFKLINYLIRYVSATAHLINLKTMADEKKNHVKSNIFVLLHIRVLHRHSRIIGVGLRFGNLICWLSGNDKTN